MTRWLWSVLLAGLGLAGLWLAGRRSRWGWLLGLGDEALWMAYGVQSRQWAFCASAAAYSWVYAQNLLAWRRDEHPPRQQRSGCPGFSRRWRAGVRRPARGGLARFGGVAAAVALLGGCVTVVRGPSLPGPSTSSAMPTADPAELADFAVWQAYEEFWWVVSHLDQQPPARWRGVLSVVTVAPELGRQLAQARDRAAGGVHRVGEVVTHVTAVRGAMSTRATLLDCQDASRAGEADNNTGRTTSTGLAATPIAATLLRTGEFAPWRVSDISYPVGRCVVDARPGGVPGAPPSPAAEIPRHENGTPRRRGQ